MSDEPADQHNAPPPGAADRRDWTFVLVERCTECGFDPGFDSTKTGTLTRAAVPFWLEVLGRSDATKRAAPTRWSALEYACHVRDVQRVFEDRLQDMLIQEDARFADWDGERAAIDERYWAADPARVAVELAESAEKIAALWDTVAGEAWERTGTRGDGKVFTVAGFARYFLHEVEHHLHDARR